MRPITSSISSDLSRKDSRSVTARKAARESPDAAERTATRFPLAGITSELPPISGTPHPVFDRRPSAIQEPRQRRRDHVRLFLALAPLLPPAPPVVGDGGGARELPVPLDSARGL